MRVRRMALFAGIVVLASCVAAKKKEKQVLPDTVLRAQTVFVVIQPDAKEPLTEANANLKAQKAVEEALMKWGKFRLALDTTTADVIISVQKGTGKAMSPTISGGPVDSRPVDVEGDASQIRTRLRLRRTTRTRTPAHRRAHKRGGRRMCCGCSLVVLWSIRWNMRRYGCIRGRMR